MCNCKNCGAPLNRYGVCEYCGTATKSGTVSRMEITSESIWIESVTISTGMNRRKQSSGLMKFWSCGAAE